MNLADDNQKISSLNIFTFIKEIYQSIKNFHKKLDSMTTQQKEFRQYIDRINKEHDLHIKRMQETIDNLALKLDNKEAINNKLKNQLESKLSNLIVETVDNNDRLNLNINELTIGNLVDNNYNISDINDQLNSNIMNNDNMFVDNNNLSDTDENNYCINGIQNKSTDIIKNDINSLINSINFDNSDNSDIDNNVNIDDNIDVDDNVDKNNNENNDFNDDNQLDYQTIKKTDIKDLIFN